MPQSGTLKLSDLPDDEMGFHPAFQERYDRVTRELDRLKIPYKMREGYRTPQKQAEYFAQGRTKPGPVVTNATGTTGYHPRGLAADIDIDPKYHRQFGEVAEREGLTWGGRWKSPYDPGHVEYRPSTNIGQQRSGTLRLADLPDDETPAGAQQTAIAAPTPTERVKTLQRELVGRSQPTLSTQDDLVRQFEVAKTLGNLDEARAVGQQLKQHGYEYGESDGWPYVKPPKAVSQSRPLNVLPVSRLPISGQQFGNRATSLADASPASIAKTQQAEKSRIAWQGHIEDLTNWAQGQPLETRQARAEQIIRERAAAHQGSITPEERKALGLGSDWLRETAGEIVGAAGGVIGNTLSMAGKIQRDAAGLAGKVLPTGGGLLDPTLLGQVGGEAMSRAGETMETGSRIETDVYGGTGIKSDIAKGVGSSVPFFATGGLGAAGRPAVGVIGALSNAGQVYDEARSAGKSHGQAMAAGFAAMPAGASEMWGVGGTLDRVARRAAVNGFVRAIVRESGEEATQEAVQTVMNNLVAKGFYDPDRDVFKDVGYNSLIAGITGGLFGTAGHAAGLAADRLTAQPRVLEAPQTAQESPAPGAPPPTTAGQVSVQAAEPGAGEISPTVPEKPETIAAQLDALKRGTGTRRAVLITEGEQMPATKGALESSGMAVTNAPGVGKFIHDPRVVSRQEVRRKAQDGTFHELLGIVEPRSATTDQAVVAREPETGTELAAAATSEPNVPAQADELKAQFPGAAVRVEPAENVIADRVAVEPRVAPEAIPETERRTGDRRVAEGAAPEGVERRVEQRRQFTVEQQGQPVWTGEAESPQEALAASGVKGSAAVRPAETDLERTERLRSAAETKQALIDQAAAIEANAPKTPEEQAQRIAQAERRMGERRQANVLPEGMTERRGAERRAAAETPGVVAKAPTEAPKTTATAEQHHSALQPRTDEGEFAGPPEGYVPKSERITDARSLRTALESAADLSSEEGDVLEQTVIPGMARGYARMTGRPEQEFYGRIAEARRSKPGDVDERAAAQRQTPKGASEFLDDGRAIIHAFEGADFSTVVHELAHVAARYLDGESLAPVNRWVGAKAEAVATDWTRPQHEKFARGFERYWREGWAPSEAVRKAFQQIKAFMTEIYRSIRGSSIDVDVSPEVRRVFDRVIGEEGRAEEAPAETTETETKQSPADRRKAALERLKAKVPPKKVTPAQRKAASRQRKRPKITGNETLTTAVIKLGRLKSLGFSGRGEVEFLSAKEGGRIGLFSKNGLTVEDMISSLEAEGWGPFEGPNELMAALEDEVRGRIHYSSRSTETIDALDSEFEDWVENQELSRQTEEDYNRAEQAVQQDPEFARLIDSISIEDSEPTDQQIEAVRQYARGIGLSPEGIDGLLTAAAIQRGLYFQRAEDTEGGYGVGREETPSLSRDQYDRAVAKFESLKRQAKESGQPLKVAVDDYLRQGGLFGQELNEQQREIIRELAGPARRAKSTAQQGSLFETGPTVESRTEQAAQQEFRAPVGKLFQEDFDPDIRELGQTHIEDGKLDFEQWSRAMIEDLDSIGYRLPSFKDLRELHDQLVPRPDYADETSQPGFKMPKEVDGVDVEQFWNPRRSAFTSPKIELEWRHLVADTVNQRGADFKKKVTLEEHRQRIAQIDPALMNDIGGMREQLILARDLFGAAKEFAQTLVQRADTIQKQIASKVNEDGSRMWPEDMWRLQAEADGNLATAQSIWHSATGIRSEMGRNLSMHRLVGGDQMDTDRVLQFVQQQGRSRGVNMDSDAWRDYETRIIELSETVRRETEARKAAEEALRKAGKRKPRKVQAGKAFTAPTAKKPSWQTIETERLTAMEAAALERIGARKSADVLYQDAWHGSPFQFDKFTLEHIGKGEGAQSYGWGLYFAGKRDVADYYRQQLSAFRLLYDGKDITNELSEHRDAVQNLYRQMRLEKQGVKGKGNLIDRAVAELREDQKIYAEWSSFYRKLERVIEATRKLDPAKLTTKHGALYKVDLAPAEDEYLLWDKPLSEQSEKVKTALATIGNDARGKPYDFQGHKDGGALYRSIAADFGELLTDLRTAEADARVANDKRNAEYWAFSRQARAKPVSAETVQRDIDASEKAAALRYRIPSGAASGEEAASRALAQAGVRGLKYLDQGSRAEGEGSYNYVIFDDADITIKDVLFQEAEPLNIPQHVNDLAAVLAARIKREPAAKLPDMIRKLTDDFGSVVADNADLINRRADDMLRTVRREVLSEAASSKDAEASRSARQQLAQEVRETKQRERTAQREYEKREKQTKAAWERDDAKARSEATKTWDQTAGALARQLKEEIRQAEQRRAAGHAAAEAKARQMESAWRVEESKGQTKAETARKRAEAAAERQAETERQQADSLTTAELQRHLDWLRSQRQAQIAEAIELAREARREHLTILHEHWIDARDTWQKTQNAADRAQRESAALEDRARRRWDWPVRFAATQAEARMRDPNYKPTVDDLAAIGAQKRLEAGMTDHRWEAEMAGYGETYTKNRRQVMGRANEAIQTARRQKKEAGQRERALSPEQLAKKVGKTEPLTKAERSDIQEIIDNLDPDEAQQLVADYRNALDRETAARRHLSRELGAVTKPSRWQSALAWAGLSKALVSAIDLPHCRQGIGLISEPKAFTQSLVASWTTWTERQMVEKVNALESHPKSETAQRFGLSQDSVASMRSPRALAHQGELPNRILDSKAMRILFPHLKPSERQFMIGLDTLRMNVWDKWTDIYREEGITPDNHPEEYKALAKMINVLSGAGHIGRFSTSELARNRVMWSARLLASRLQMLNYMVPISTTWGGGWAKLPPRTRRFMARKMAGFTTAMGLLAVLPAALGIGSLDPDDDDFLKFHIPGMKTRLDLTGGFGSYIKTAWKLGRTAYWRGTNLLSGTTKKRIFKSDTELEILGRFARGKVAPAIGTIIDWQTGRTYTGEPFAPGKDAWKGMVPMYARDVGESYKFDGAAGLAMSVIPGYLGIGISAYDKPEYPDQSKSEAARYVRGFTLEKMGDREETRQDYDRRAAIKRLAVAMKERRPANQIEALRAKVTQYGGPLTKDEEKSLKERVEATPLQFGFKSLGIQEAEEAFSKAKDAERESLTPIIEQKRMRAKRKARNEADYQRMRYANP